MKHTVRNHLTNPLAQLQNIYTKTSNQGLSSKDIEKNHLELLKLLKNPTIIQSINLLEQQKKKTAILHEELSKAVLKELNSAETCIEKLMQKYDQKTYNTFLVNNNLNIQDSIPTRFQNVQNLIVAYLQTKRLAEGNEPFWVIYIIQVPELKQIADDILRTANFIAWERNYKTYASNSKILNKIVQLHSDIAINYDSEFEKICMAINVQEICSCLINALTITNELSTLKIHSISYAYIPKTKKKKATLKLYINDKSIDFSGDTATMLKIILDNPFDEIDIDEFNFENAVKKDATSTSGISLLQKLYRKFEKINSGIALSAELCEFGILSFLKYKKNLMWLNPLYRNSLSPVILG